MTDVGKVQEERHRLHDKRVERCIASIRALYTSLRGEVESWPGVVPRFTNKGGGIDFWRSNRKFFSLHPKHAAARPNIGVAFWCLDEDEVHRLTGLEPRKLKQDGVWVYAFVDAPDDRLKQCARQAYERADARSSPAQESLELTKARRAAEAEGAFDATDSTDARKKVLAAIVQRQGQTEFRSKLLYAYEGRCAISGCTVPDVLDAAHLVPYLGAHSHHPSNGLLLRADLHRLLDLGLLSINPQTMAVELESSLMGTAYEEYHGRVLVVPRSPAHRPSKDALAAQRKLPSSRR